MVDAFTNDNIAKIFKYHIRVYNKNKVCYFMETADDVQFGFVALA